MEKKCYSFSGFGSICSYAKVISYIAFSILLVAFGNNSYAQTLTLLSPTGDGGFETGASFAANGWTVVNATTNIWNLSAVATPYAGARSAFIGNAAGTNNNYNNGASRTDHFYRDIAIPAGANSITLSFELKGSGETGWDRLLVYTAPNTVTPVANTPASSTTALAGATLIYTQPAFYAAYTLVTLTVPDALAGTTVRFIFTWQNDASFGTNPAASVDNISLTCCPLPAANTGTATVCQNATTTLSNSGTGTWSSSNTAVATASGAVGTVTGVSGGTANITFTSSCGQTATTIVTVIPSPTISGAPNICVSTSTMLTGAPGGGTWISVSPGIAGIDATGLVTAGAGVGTTVISYTGTNGCVATSVETVSNTAPAAITGPAGVCPGLTITLTDPTPGGGWTSLNTSVATVVGTSGVVTGIGGGTATIQYSTGCGTPASYSVSINPNPSISGPPGACVGGSSTLTGSPGGGTWLSTSTGVATITGGGVLSGVAVGISLISYTSTLGCIATAIESVGNTVPTVTATVSPTVVCSPGSSTLSSTASGAPLYSVYSTPYALSTITTSSGTVAGDDVNSGAVTLPFTFNFFGTNYNSIYVCTNGWASFTSTGTSLTNYTIPSTGAQGEIGPGIAFGLHDFNTGSGGTISYGYSGTAPNRLFIIYFNGLVDFSGGGHITGQIILHETTNIIDEMLTSSTYATYASTLGIQDVVATNGFAPATRNGWTSSVATAEGWRFDPNFTYSYLWSPSTFLSSSTAQNPTISGATTTTNYSVTTYLNGCGSSAATATLTVNTTPAAIGGGTTPICSGATTTLTDATPGGAWGSADPTIATVSAGGVVTGVAGGTVSITYSNGCGTAPSVIVTVNQSPIVSGGSGICVSSTTTLSAVPAGCTWSSSAPGIASIVAATGVLTSGASLGTTNITATSTLGCVTTFVETVNNASPGAISGGGTPICTGATTTLTDGTPGGAWSSSAPGTATVDVTTGLVTGITAGTAVISYSTGCGTPPTQTVTVNAAPVISGAPGACVGANTTLTAIPGGGNWVSTTTSVATIGAASGIMTGVANGSSLISYTSTSGCLATVTEFVGNVAPTVTTSSPGALCSPGSTTLSANASGAPVYLVYSIPYALSTITTSSGTVAGDDVNSGAVALPFTFNYFGTPYTSIYVCTNGWASFTATGTSLTNYTIPSANALSEVGAGIAFGLHDLNTGSGGTISYGYTGTAPNRSFIIWFNGVADFSGVGSISGQIILHETTNVIDEMLTSFNHATYASTLGIQSSTATLGYAPATRNGWTTSVATPEGWRYQAPPAYTYLWTPSTYLSSNTAQNPSVTGATATTVYSVTAYVSGCGSTPATATVTVNQPPNVSGLTVASATNACSGTSSTVTVNSSSLGAGTYTVYYNLSGANTVTGHTATLTMGAATGTFVIPSSDLGGAGSNTVTVTSIVNATLCPSSVTTSNTASFGTGAPAFGAPTNSGGTICSGGTVSLFANPTGTPTGYTWAGPALSSTTDQNPTANPTVTSVYSLTVSSICGLSPVYTTTVVVTSLPTAIAPTTTPNPVCQGSAIALNGNVTGGSGLVYSWTGPTTGITSSAVLNATIPSAAAGNAGSYTLTVTLSGCPGTMSGNTNGSPLVVNSLPTSVTPSVTPTSVCGGNTITLTGNVTGGSGLTYAWTGPTTGIASAGSVNTTIPSAVIANNGSYTLTVTAAGCGASSVSGNTNSTPVVVNVLPTSVAPTATPTPVCQGSPITLTGNVTGGSGLVYSWTGPTTGITDPTVVNATIPSAAAANAGSYTLTVTLSGGCPGTMIGNTNASPTVVGSLPLAILPSSSPNPICAGSTITLTGNVFGGSGLSYSWSGPTTGIASATSVNTTIPSAVTANAGSYTLTVSAAGCGATVSGNTNGAPQVVGALPATVAPTSSPNPACEGNPITLTGNVTGGSGLVYSWSGPTTGIASATSVNTTIPSADVVNDGSYTLTVTAGGCAGSVSGNTNASPMVVNSLPLAILPASSPNPVCTGSAITLTGNVFGGSGLSYSWSGPTTGISSATSVNTTIPSAVLANAGSYTLTVTAAGCGATVSGNTNGAPQVVGSLPTAVAPTSTPNPVCQGSAITLTGNVTGGTGLSYVWSGPTTGIASSTSVNTTIPSAVAGNAGSYTLTVTAPGCAGSMSGNTNGTPMVVNSLPTSVLPSTSPNPVCTGNAITLTGNVTGGSGLSYAWSGPTTGIASATSVNTSIPSAVVGNAGSYTLTVTAAGCAGSMNGNTNGAPQVVGSLPTAVAPTSTPNPVCQGSAITLTGNVTGGTGLNYAWSGPTTGIASSTSVNTTIPSAVAGNAGSYTLTVTAPGCAGSMSGNTNGTPMVVNSLPTSVLPSTSPNPVCTGNAITLTGNVTGGSGLSYAWSGPTSGIASATSVNTSIPSAVVGNAGSYTLTVTAAGCAGSMVGNTNGAPQVVGSLPTAVAPTSGPNPACVGGTITLTGNVTGGTGLSYAWSGPTTGIASAASVNTTIPSAVVANAGSYTLTVTAPGCAGNMAGNTIGAPQVVNTPPTSVLPANSPNPACAGNPITLTGNVTGGTGLSYSWTGPTTGISDPTVVNATIPSAAAANAGSYTLTVTAAGCTPVIGNTNSTPQVVNALPTAVAPTSGPNPACVGGTITLTGNVTGGAGLAYAWSGPTTGIASATSVNTTIPSAVAGNSGSYTLTVTAPGCAGNMAGNTNGAPQVVNTPPTSVLPANSPNPACAGNPITLTGNVTGGTGLSYSWTGPTTGITDPTVVNATIPSAAAANAGSYTLTVTAAGCAPVIGNTNGTPQVVNALPTSVAPTSGPNPACVGGTITLTGNVTGGAGLAYAWSGPTTGIASATSVNTTILSAVAGNSGSYTLTVTAPGCAGNMAGNTNGAPQVVNTPPTSVSPASSPNPVCLGTAIALTGNVIGGTGLSYAWTGPTSGIASATSVNTTIPSSAFANAGSYTLTVTAAGCAPVIGNTNSAPQVVVNAPDVSNFNTTGATSVCNGNASVVTVTSTSLSSISYTVTYNLTGANSSSGNTATLTMSGGSGTITIPAGSISSVGSTTVTITSISIAGSCNTPISSGNTAAFNVNGVPSAVTVSGAGTFCTSATLTAVNGGSGTIYFEGTTSGGTSIAVPATTQVVTVTGTYYFRAQMPAGGCWGVEGSAAVTILPSASAAPTVSNALICNGGTVTFTAHPSGGAAVYNWSGPNLSSATAQNPTATPPTGVNTYSLTVNGPGCVVSPVFTVVVTANPTPAAAPSATTPICVGGTTSLTANPSGGASVYTWTGAAISSTSVQNPTANPVASTIYSLSVSDGSGLPGCSPATVYTTSVTVNGAPSLASVTNNSPICAGANLNLGVTGASNVTGYSWSGPVVVAASTSAAAGIPAATTAAGGVYTLTVTDGAGSGCTAVYTTSATVKTTPVAAPATSTPTICNGGTALLSANPAGGATVYSWSGAGLSSTTAQNPTATPSFTATYSLTVTDGSGNPGCSPGTLYTTIVTVNPTPIAAPSSTTPICNGGTVFLSANPAGGAAAFTWVGANMSSTSVANPTATPTATTVYSLTVSDGSGNPGCSPGIVYTTSVTVKGAPSVSSVTNSTPICIGGTITLTATGAANVAAYLWSGPVAVSGATTPTATVTGASLSAGGVYSLTVNNGAGSGCQAIYTATATVNPMPTVYAITGGGNYCPGGTGVVVGLSNSDAGIFYQLYNGASAVGTPVAGINGALSFGLQTASGTYSVVADPATSCAINMSGVTPVIINTPPVVYNVTGGGQFCAGGIGVHIGLNYSVSGVNYQLYNGAATVGSPVVGGDAALDFGLQTAPGTYTVTATTISNSCHSNMNGSAGVTVNALPAVHAMTGGGSYCAGGTGVAIGLDGSDAGISYQLYRGATAVGAPVAGVPGILSFPLQTVAGTYSVAATNGTTSCTSNMTGSESVSINALPAVQTVSGGGAYCAGGAGQHIFLSGSVSTVNYQLYHGSSTVGATTPGTGSGLDFGAQTAAGVYTVLATDATGTGCSIGMSGSAAITINPLPAVFNMTGGGSYCSGGAGVHIGLDGSTAGISYQVFNGASTVGSAVIGTGGVLDLGAETTATTYTVVAANVATTCTSNMTGSESVTVNALPSVYNVSGGGSLCAGSAGVVVSLSGADNNISYQLYNGATTAGSAVTGTTGAFSFPAQTTAGTYTVLATNTTTNCTNNMSGSAGVTVNALPAAFIVTGGGNYCIGGAGVHVGLNGSSTGINYQLYNGSTAGVTLPGNGSALDYGLETTLGVYSVLATNPATSCNSNMTGTVTVSTNALPANHTITGGGSYCSGSTGVTVGLDGSDNGINYQLYDGASAVGSVMAGTGTAINFGNQTLAGTYSVLATDASASCTGAMLGTVGVTINALPAVYAVTGGGSYCLGGNGVHVGLGGSTSGIHYQLFTGGSQVGSDFVGSGSAIDFGLQTAAGSYSVVAVNTTTSCTSNMSGSVGVSINALPALQTVTGGGAYCAGGTGLHIGLSGSENSITYQAYNGTTAIGSPVTGTGAVLDLGLETVAGVYTVQAVNPLTTCVNNMTGSVGITVNPLPAVFSVTGGGSYCLGGSGVHIGLNNSVSGINYHLYNGSTEVLAMPGTGVALDYGAQTAAGTYSVLATDGTTSCANNMSGTTGVTINALPAVNTVGGGGVYCAGGAGMDVTLDGSVNGVNYQLYNGATAIGTTVSGTGSLLDFGLQTGAGTYTVAATNGSTGCTSNMLGSAGVTVNAIPTVYSITGGGSYCLGGTGVNIGLNLSQVNVNYQLYNGSSTTGTLVPGTGAAISFGPQTASGVYTVLATTTAASCPNGMSGIATVSINALPLVHNLSGGGVYCFGTSGSDMILDGSNTGINYQLYNGSSMVGIPIAGTGLPLDYGTQSALGVYSVLATNTSTTCVSNMTGTPAVSVNPQPAVHSVAGGGTYCAGGTGFHIGLDGSETGINYRLYNGAVPVGVLLLGNTGSSLDFGVQTAAGTYTVVATNGTTGCTSNMSGSAGVSINPLPQLQTVTGGGGYCLGTTGIDLGLSSSDNGINYQLYNGSLMVGPSVPGTGTSLDFGIQSVAGTYTVLATDAATSCMNTMTGSAIVSVNPLPVVYSMTGGGSYCQGSNGLNVGLSNSEAGMQYQLYNGASIVGGPVTGTGIALDFGVQSVSGTYSVAAMNSATSCVRNMFGTATVTVNAVPVVYDITGSAAYCAGGSGIDIALPVTESGISYQLYNGTLSVGSPITSAGGVVDFGLQTVAGTYTISAANPVTTCNSNMTGAMVISVNALPAVHTMGGGGNYCFDDSGMHVTLNGSDLGISYQLYNGASLVGTPLAGTGAALDFGLQTVAGGYTVVGTNTVTGCVANMSGTSTIVVNSRPNVYTFTSIGSSYCAGGAGIDLNLSNSDVGVNYQLYLGSLAVGAPVAGINGFLDLGNFTAQGGYIVVASNPANACSSVMSGTAAIVINPLPAIHTLTGGGAYCAGGTGVDISLNASDTGITYHLAPGTASLAGTGLALDYGLQAVAGSYTVTAVNNATGCTTQMSGHPIVTVNPLPAIYAVSGGGTFCFGGAGFDLTLSNSTLGVNYQLFNGSTPVGLPVHGTGTILDLGFQTAAGTYTVQAANVSSTCRDTMTGAAVIYVNPVPVPYAMTGGGSFCAGGNGVHIGTLSSDTGVHYQLYNGAAMVGGIWSGTGAALDFGLQTASGTYSVVAVDSVTACASNLSGTEVVVVNALPAAYAVTGGGSYCQGTGGVHVGVASSASGINYQLFNGVIPIGFALPGSSTGAAIDFGLQTATGIYSVIATNTLTTCTNKMSDSVAVTTTPTVVPTVSVATGMGDTLCLGIYTTFTATAVNGGSAPLYQWNVNGVNVGSSANTYSYIPVSGDVVMTTLTSSAACATPAIAVVSHTITVTGHEMPGVAISADHGLVVCAGTLVTYTATPIYGGTAPAFTWLKNNVVVGTGTTYSYIPVNNDVVACKMISNFPCRLADSAEKDVTMVVDTPQTPVVTITANPGTAVTQGQSVTFTATVANAGPAPLFQWFLNTSPVAGATTAVYTADYFADKDSVSCFVTGSGSCMPVVGFNTVVLTIYNVGVKQVVTTASDVRLLPNPNAGDFTIKGTLGTSVDEEVTIEVTDLLGQVIYNEKIQALGGNINKHITLTGTLANGMYMLNLRSESGNKTFHFVIGQ